MYIFGMVKSLIKIFNALYDKTGFQVMIQMQTLINNLNQ